MYVTGVKPTLRKAGTSRRLLRVANVTRLTIYVCASLLAILTILLPSAALASSNLPRTTRQKLATSSQPVSRQCPWTNPIVQASSTPNKLAAEVLARMTLAEKAKFVILSNKKGYENMNTGIPKLCIPALTLSDGPDGVAYGMRGVTQLPASIGVAASFDPTLAFAYGRTVGQEAKGKGVDVIQGPNLNIARVPEAGRIFEGYGEDPYLVSQLGVADIQGIQSTGTMANAKHFTGYNQETARLLINQKIPLRALEELYLAPFQAAVQEGHVASLMCSYGSLNGVNDCSDKSLYQTLYADWGFNGFVRSDLDAVPNMPNAFAAGLSMVKPASPKQLVAAVHTKQLSNVALNTAVTRVLRDMFAYGLIGGQHSGNPKARVTSKAHSQVAVQAAEESMVLLKNSGTLPLTQASDTIAVIGRDAGRAAARLGNGSAGVRPGAFVTPLSAIQAAVAQRTSVSYANGVPSNRALPGIPWTAYVSGQPLTLVPNPSFLENAENHGSETGPQAGTSDIRIALRSNASPEVATASHPLSNNPNWMNWEATIVPPKTGLYDISLTNDGDSWLSINNKPVLSFSGLHNHSTWDTAMNLTAGHRYQFKLQWFQTGSLRPLLGWENMSPVINKAVAAARKAKTAIVFANDYNSEGLDRPNLYLPGAQNQLIEAVAAANPHTVVVLNTGGAVFMPWLNRVSAVIEAWYPGQADGTATTAVLFGKVDPSGRLPLTFPTVSSAAKQFSSAAQWPGTNGTVDYSEGLDVGYRYYTATGQKPLFPFGFGLSYTSFQLAQPTVSAVSAGTDQITVPVTNTGSQAGAAVVQSYIDYPPGSGEPPRELRSFARVTLAPGQTGNAGLTLNQAAFQLYKDGKFSTPPGAFTVWVGTSSENLPYSLTVTP